MSKQDMGTLLILWEKHKTNKRKRNHILESYQRKDFERKSDITQDNCIDKEGLNDGNLG